LETTTETTDKSEVIIYNGLLPAWDYILVRLEDNEYKGTLIVPDTAKDASHVGEVLAIGPGKDGDVMICEVGDRIMFNKYAGADIEWEKEKLLLLRQTEIVCFITKRK
jgi:chaperonin GroES